jgi:hypothetical protein
MSGARVAAYLRGDTEAERGSDKILERLAAPQAVAPTPAPAPESVKAVDQKKLAALAEPAPLPDPPLSSRNPPNWSRRIKN